MFSIMSNMNNHLHFNSRTELVEIPPDSYLFSLDKWPVTIKSKHSFLISSGGIPLHLGVPQMKFPWYCALVGGIKSLTLYPDVVISVM